MSLFVIFALGLIGGAAVALAAGWGAAEIRRRQQLTGELAKLEQMRYKARPETLESSVAALNALMDRSLGSIESLDRKAAVIPPAVGIAATIALARAAPVDQMSGYTLAMGWAGLVLGVVSLAAATFTLLPISFKAGPNPITTAMRTNEEKLDFDQGLANALAKAVASAQSRAAWKGRGVFLSMLALLGTVMALAAFATTGGFRP